MNNIACSSDVLNKWLTILIYLITPFAFVINIYFFIILIIMQCLIILMSKKKYADKFLIILLNSLLYSGISILGLRLYDWIIIFVFIWLIIAQKGHVKIQFRFIGFLLGVVFVFIYHGMPSNEVLEVVRYLISVILVIIILNITPNLNNITEYIMRICLANLYNAIVICVLMTLGWIHNYTFSFFSTNIYIYSGELRMNGFFSDPNKYMTFALAMIVLVDIFVENVEYKRRIIVLLSLSAILSLSRTAILCLGIYYVLKLIRYLQVRDFRLFYITIVVLAILIVCLLFFPDMINTMLNNLFIFAANILGRQKTIEINATVQSDNRVIIWKMAREYIVRKPILGNGWMAYSELLPYPTHNTIISLLLDGGIVMLGIYIYTFWFLYTYKRYDVVIPCVIIPSLFLDLGNYRMWFLLLAMIILKRQKDKECEFKN